MDELERRFYRILEEADPNFSDRPELAEEFARRLADFAESWASGKDIDKEEKALSRWIESNVRKSATTTH